MKKKEIIIFAALLILSGLAWFFLSRSKNSKDYGSIRISVAGEEYGVYSLNEDQKIKINGTNTVRIKDHEASMVEADCPDHLCVSMMPIDERGGMIVCLPNQVIVEGIPSADAEKNGDVLDGVTG